MKKMTILIVSWLSLFIFGMFRVESQGALRANISAPKELDESGVAKSQAGVNANAQQDAVQRPQIEYKVQGLRDPFEPLVREERKDTKVVSAVEVKPLPSLTVQGMIWGGVMPQAIINNKIVKVGDTIEGVKIKSINKEGVTVLFANKEHKLSTSLELQKGSKKDQ